ncbi:MAG: ThuA domain-containing protein [Daejeonella sp.]|uniref:ThuA domain-containing protein n=1 Tax=Daejeonella sp. TaxID=2805397 RepID=UPI002733D98E|nr:ThuA domain-containing protein [Daejeonella sp.]MDP3467928.1 ThuA domain-containing protein [Daejeonella sp.]
MNKQTNRMLLIILITFIHTGISFAQSNPQWVVYQGNEGPGKGKHIVFVSGDEEYRSEEGLPMLAKILAERHGFKCTVLFAVDPKTNNIDPDNQTNIPGLEHLKTADLMVMLLRFRELPDEQMKHIVDYTNAGKPIVALRTSTHAFSYSRNKENPYAKYSYNSKIKGWEGGYGKQVLGETWINHHGVHAKEGTRALINGLVKDHAILRGVKDIWTPTDVYGILGLPNDAQVLIFGQTTMGMSSTSPLSYEKSVMPVAWIRNYSSASGKKAKIFTTTMGASIDLISEDLRRLIVNACYWSIGMENLIPAQNNVQVVGDYNPTMFGFGKYQRGLSPSTFEWKK